MNNKNNYRSNISVGEYRSKLYVDPQYGDELNPSVVNYAVLSSSWEIEDVKEDHIISIIHKQSGDSIRLSFNSFKDKLAFAANIYSSGPVKQVGKGHNLEELANMHLLEPGRNNLQEWAADISSGFYKLRESINLFKDDGPVKKIKTIFRKGLLAN